MMETTQQHCSGYKPTKTRSGQTRVDVSILKSQVDLLEIVRRYVPDMKKAGREWEGCCPFHQETTPSFKVDPEKQVWNCLGRCQQGGDVIRFIEKIQGVKFQDALRYLAGQSGPTPSPSQPDQKTSQGKKLVWLPITPIPDDATEPPHHYRYGAPSHRWIYRDTDGHALFHVCRFNKSDAGKEILPQTLCRDQETGKISWRWQGLPS
ncbi:MAG: CHC2 zinc finger domain-containing protein, partial [Magnetococcus sp. YQC-5]